MFSHLYVSHSVHRGQYLSRGVSVQGVSVWRGALSGRHFPCMVTCGQYISYWNAFLFILIYLSQFIRKNGNFGQLLPLIIQGMSVFETWINGNH